jgi:hypothetical protein
MHLDGEHAKPFLKRKVGDKVHFTGHGEVSRISTDQNEDGEPMHNVTLKVKEMKHRKKTAELPGQAGGKDAEMQKGGKAAMDQALALDAETANQANAESGSGS